MQNNKKIIFIIEIALILSVTVIALTLFKNEYLFEWAIHNKLFTIVLSAIPLIILAAGYLVISLTTTFGIVLGLFIGNFLGNIIMKNNISKIVEGMSAEQVSQLHHHPGFEIWILFIITSFVIGIIVHHLIQRRK